MESGNVWSACAQGARVAAVYGLILLTSPASAQEPVRPAAGKTEERTTTFSEPRVRERGPHHRVIERTVTETLPDGTTRERKSSYTELATGLHYLDERGEWIESREEIEILNGAAVARQGSHKVIFAANINSAGAIDVQDALGQRYRSHVLGLVYTDYASGRSVMIAGVKDSIGELVAPNQVLYPDALEGDCSGDIRYSYTKAGFEQDIILRTAPPSPAEWGLDPETTRLEVFTEFIEIPAGTMTAEVIQGETDPAARAAMKEPDLIDQRLDFGGMVFGPGQAFPLDGQADSFSEDSVPTGKSLELIEGRRILIEKVDYPTVERQLGRLPKSASLDRNRKVTLPEPGRTLQARALPARPAGVPGQWTRRLQASVDHRARPGFVLDYVSIGASSLTNYCFKGDSTYYISGSVNLYGTNIMEGGTVLKYAVAGQMTVQSGARLDFRTGPYRPANFTAREDDTIGEIIAGSSGTPTNGAYSSGGMLRFISTTTTNEVSNLRISYPYVGIALLTSSKADLSHLQVGRGKYALVQQNNSVATTRNFLFHDLSLASVFITGTVTNRLEHGTIHRTASLRTSTTGLYSFTNSLLISVTNNLVFQGQNNITNLSDTGFFQTVGAATHYLASGSTNRDAGTTNINPALLAALQKKTTHPPIVLTNAVTNDTTLTVQAARDADVPDLGYHYDPLDYAGTSLTVSNATLTLGSGAALGLYGSSSASGVLLLDGGKMISEGTPDNLNRIVRYNLVQEQSITNWSATSVARSISTPGTYSTNSILGEVRLRFTELSMPANGSDHIYLGASNLTVNVRDSQFHGGQVTVLRPDATLLNNLFNRVTLKLYAPVNGYTALMRNGTHFGGSVTVSNNAGGTWTVRDNLFDTTNVLQNGTVGNNWNAYLTNGTRLTPNGGNDVLLTVTNITYDPGWLGRFYVPTNLTSHSPIFNAGSQNATNAGLYHYTMVTNQTRELSTTVDIGFHYVAVGTTGVPLDTDADGSPNYLEDANGNGVADGTETSTVHPVLTLAGTMTYIKGGPAKRFDTNAVAYDADAANLAGATLTATITIGAETGDRLAVRHQGTNAGQIGVSGTNISFGGTIIATNSGGSGTTPLVIHFNASAGNAALQALARQLTFQNLSNAPVITNRTVKFELNDGRGGTNTPATVGITIVCPDAVDVMMLFDRSGSMEKVFTNGVYASNDVNRFWTAKAAASNFVSLFNFTADRVGLITFDGGAQFVHGLTTNAPAVQASIYSQTIGSGTILDPPINMARTNYATSGSNTLRLMVILSDGEEWPATNTSVTLAAAEAAKDEGIRIISIGFHTGECTACGGTNHMRLIASSDLDYYFAPSFEQMQSNFTAVAQSLCRGVSEVSLTSPATGSIFTNPPAIELTATAADSEGVARVEFYQSDNKLGEDASSPYALTWASPAPGTNVLTAVLIDGLGNATTSAPVNVIVRSSPSVSLVAPTNATHFAAVMHLLVRAAATDADGTITNVVFYTNGVKAVNVTNPPFRFPWTNLPAGTNYRIHAVAWDNDGLTNTSGTNTFVVDACPQVGVSNLTLSSSSVPGGSNVTATITLSNAAPMGGQLVALTVNQPSVSIPASVLVPAGTNQVTLRVDTFTTDIETIATLTAATPAANRTASLTVEAATISSTRFPGQCGPMDVVFVIHRSRSAWSSLGMDYSYGGAADLPIALKTAFTNIIDSIAFASKGDYRLGMVTFASNQIFSAVQLDLTNRNEFLEEIHNFSAMERTVWNGQSDTTTTNAAEPSVDALKVVINNLTPASQTNLDIGFTNQFRQAARRVIVLMTDTGPMVSGEYYLPTPGVPWAFLEAHQQAVSAALKRIEIYPVVLPNRDSTTLVQYFEPTISAARDYSHTTGGRYSIVESVHEFPFVLPSGEPDPVPFDVALGSLSSCGSDGDIITIRDDLRSGAHGATVLLSSAASGATLDTATFDLSGIEGRVSAAHLQRAGRLRVNHGSQFDLALGAGSVLDGNLAWFAAPQHAAHTNGLEVPYLTAWELPFPFFADAQGYLGGLYPVQLLDRLGSLCGNHVEVIDTPQADWPAARNTLTLKTLGAFEIPQGRCRDFVLTGETAPCSGTNAVCSGDWEILLYGEVIASECGPNGWSVESDHGVFGGVNICAPPDALTAIRYEVRFLENGTTARSGFFSVIPAGMGNTASVLKPLALSLPTCSSNTPVTVTVSLDAPAREQEAIVAISVTGITNTNIPAFVRIPLGATSTSFTFRPTLVTSNTPFTIRANYNGVRRADGVVIVETNSLSAPVVSAISDSNRVVVTWSQVPGALTYDVSRYDGMDTLLLASGLSRPCFVDEAPSTDIFAGNCYTVVAINSLTNASSIEECEFFTEVVLRPRITPHGGRFNDYVWITITCETPGATIRYTTNGVPPVDASDGIEYIGPTNLSASVQVIARAFVSANASPEDRADFHIAGATPIACGVPVQTTITDTNQPSTFFGPGFYAARYRFEGLRGDAISFTASSPSFAPVLTIIDPNKELVHRDGVPLESLTGARPAFLDHTLKTNGTYVVEVIGGGEVTVKLDCFPGPELDVFHDGAELPNASTLDFGLTPNGTSVTRTITLTNSGSVALNISSVSITPPELFSISPAVLTNLPVNGVQDIIITFNAASNGPWNGTLVIENDDGFDDTPAGTEFDDPFVVQLEAFANPPGVPPTAEITSPANLAVVTMPPAVVLSAVSISNGTDSVTGVVFYAKGPTGPRQALGHALSNNVNAWSFPWSNAPSGAHQLTALAKDSAGRAAFSSAITVTNNLRPVAVNDRLSVNKNAGWTLLEVLANDYDGDGGSVVVSNLVPVNGSPSHGSINILPGGIDYQPYQDFTGYDTFLYVIADQYGALATGSVRVAVYPPFSEWVAPVVAINTPPDGIEINGPTNVTGTASHLFLQAWELQYQRRGRGATGRWVTFAEGNDAVTNGFLGVFDPTGLPSGQYDIALRVWDQTSTRADTSISIRIGDSPKIGHFTLAFTDLQIPVSGLPITLTRSYDSRNTESGDFGAGWNLDISSVRLEKSGIMGEGWDSVITGFAGISQCVVETEPHLVTITFPDDKVYRFQAAVGLNNRSEPCTGSGGLGGAEAHITYTPLPGSLGTLRELGSSTLLKVGYIDTNNPVTFHDARDNWDELNNPGLFGPVYDPKGFEFETLDGRKFRFNALGKVTNMVDRVGNSLTFRDDGIIHSSGKSVKFIRDAAGRITEIYDPNGLSTNGLPNGPAALSYKYDSAGNLIHVHRLTTRSASDPKYVTTRFGYEHTKYPHYITKITDPRGVTGIRNEYGDDGKLAATTDASGKKISFTHNVSGKTETIVDRLGNTSVFKYDVKGNVTNSVNALGHTNLYAYDADNNLTLEVDANGRTNSYAYDSQGNRTHIVDPLGRTNRFNFDVTGSLLAHIDPLGNVSSNRYDSVGNLTNVIRLNVQGQIIEQSFSKFVNGHLVETRDGSNRLTASFGYDLYGNLTNTVDAKGIARSFRYDANGQQTNMSFVWVGPGGSNITVTVSTEFDAEGKVVRTVDASGIESRTTHNPIGKADFTIDRLGNTNRFVYDSRGTLIQATSPNGTFTRTVYDDNGRAILSTDRNGVTGTRTEYDALGRVTNTMRLTGVSIDLVEDAGNPGEMRSVIGSAGTPISTNSTEYFANGWVKTRTGTDGGRTTYDYWADGQLKTVADALTNTTHFEYDEAGHQKLVRDALNRTNQFEYDGAGRMMKAIYANGSFTSNQFNALGQRVGQVDQAGLVTQFGYDVSGQLTNVTKPPVPDPENGQQMVSPNWSYRYDDYGRLTVSTDPKGRTNTFGYDELGRPVTRRLPMGQTDTNVYNAKGQLWKRYDFKGQKTELVYDKYGRTSAKFFFNAGATYPSNAVCYQFNTLGQLWKIVERSGADATTNACDGYGALVGLPVLRKGPDGLLAQLRRVPAPVTGGMLAMVLLALACAAIPRTTRQALTASLLEACRSQCDMVAADVRRRRWRLVGSHAVEMSASLPRRLRLPAFGWRFASLFTVIALLVSDPHFDALFTAQAACTIPSNSSTETTRLTEFTYDDEGRLTQVNAPEGVINYGYDLATGRHTSTCTTNSEVAYGYDQLGRLKTVTVLKRNGVTLGTPETTTYTYTAVGSRDTVTLPNGIVTTWRYDNLNRLTNLTHQVGTTNLATYSYQLHSTGRRTGATEILLNTNDNSYVTNTLTWQYDGMYRLTNEVSTSSLSSLDYTRKHEYDKAGNRVKQTRGTETITYQYNANDQLTNEVSSVSGTTTYLYDANGSLTNKATSGGTVGYAYNLANKLSSVNVGGVTTSYLYNDSGIRVRSVTGTSTNLYLVDANNRTGYAQVLEELSAIGGAPSRSYVIGDDVLGQATSTTTSWLLYDGHGSTRQLVKSGADVTSQYHFDGYGASLTTLPSNPETSLLYSGEQFDSTLQMYNLRARFYDPSNGRFNARDTHNGGNSDPQSLHKYGYCHGDPVNGIDPSGHFNIVQVAIGVATGVALAAFYAARIVGRVKTIKHMLSPTPFKRSNEVPDFDKQLAHLSSDVYEESRRGHGNWSPVSPQERDALGLQGAVFESGSFFSQLYIDRSRNAYVLAFRGTTPTDMGDWYSNAAQGGFGLAIESQYTQAVDLVRDVSQAVRGAELTVTGHSLGGGLASTAALEANLPAVTFNAAGVNALTMIAVGASSYTSSTVNYSVAGEILTSLQNRTFAAEAFGQLYQIEPHRDDAHRSPIELHGMKYMLNALK